jgi:hypothetical protein
MNDKYQIGQAVIYLSNNKPELGFITGNDYPVLGYPVVNLLGTHVTHIGDDSKPATEVEILAEIEKHGWLKDTNAEQEWYSASKEFDLYIGKIDRWSFDFENQPFITEENCLAVGNKLIQAHRIITALNLANCFPHQ